jgi:hypothetical protein
MKFVFIISETDIHVNTEIHMSKKKKYQRPIYA